MNIPLFRFRLRPAVIILLNLLLLTQVACSPAQAWQPTSREDLSKIYVEPIATHPATVLPGRHVDAALMLTNMLRNQLGAADRLQTDATIHSLRMKGMIVSYQDARLDIQGELYDNDKLLTYSRLVLPFAANDDWERGLESLANQLLNDLIAKLCALQQPVYSQFCPVAQPSPTPDPCYYGYCGPEPYPVPVLVPFPIDYPEERHPPHPRHPVPAPAPHPVPATVLEAVPKSHKTPHQHEGPHPHEASTGTPDSSEKSIGQYIPRTHGPKGSPKPEASALPGSSPAPDLTAHDAEHGTKPAHNDPAPSSAPNLEAKSSSGSNSTAGNVQPAPEHSPSWSEGNTNTPVSTPSRSPEPIAPPSKPAPLPSPVGSIGASQDVTPSQPAAASISPPPTPASAPSSSNGSSSSFGSSSSASPASPPSQPSTPSINHAPTPATMPSSSGNSSSSFGSSSSSNPVSTPSQPSAPSISPPPAPVSIPSPSSITPSSSGSSSSTTPVSAPSRPSVPSFSPPPTPVSAPPVAPPAAPAPAPTSTPAPARGVGTAAPGTHHPKPDK